MENNCPYFKECGGCNYLDISYQDEIEKKKKYLQSLFKQINYNHDIEVVANDTPYNYRNKAIMAFKVSRSGKIVSGIYEEGTRHIVSVNNCLIQAKKINELLLQINDILTKNKIKPYGFGGVLKHVLVRYGFKTEELLVTFVTSDEMFPGRNNIVKDLIKENKNVKTIVQNIQPRQTPIVLGERERVLYGPGYIYDYLGEVRFKISSKSFYQINPNQTLKLYDLASKYADIKESDIVIDAYSGIGTIGLYVSKNAKEVFLVENNRDAYKDSLGNIKNNNIKNVESICDDSTKFLQNLALTNDKVDVLIMDPPREGSTIAFIDSVTKLKIKKVVYISCNPETQIRDLKQFIKNGYVLTNVKGVDLFSRTNHVESIALIVRKDAK